jgi:Flp pilus assembly protein TadG
MSPNADQGRPRRRPPGFAGVAVEYGLLLPALLFLVLGVIDAGRVIWTQVTLEHAVEAAARCAAINSTLCGTTAQIQAYAVTQAYGLTIAASAFTPTTTTCGARVTGTFAFSFITPWIGQKNLTLQATSCQPIAS